MKTTERGIRKTPSGFQVYVRVRGEFRSKHFPPDTPLEDLRQWRDERTARRRFKIPDPVLTGDDFGSDCARYLAAVKGMTTYKDRAYRIHLWRDALGRNRSRAEITSVEIRQQLERWKLQGKAPGTLNTRRTALMHLYSVLDGKSARNIVRDIPRYREIPPPLRLPTAKQIDAALRKMRKDAKGRHRLRVLMETGWPPAQLMKLKPDDVDWRKRLARLSARRKGQGSPAAWLPLTPKAVAALKAFDKADAWGKFSTHSLRKRLVQACKSAGVPYFRIYDLRHRWLTKLVAVAKDDRAASELAQHSDPRQIRRYTEQSVSSRVTAAIRKLASAR
jgi:integrase